jgi:hypothetical protein
MNYLQSSIIKFLSTFPINILSNKIKKNQSESNYKDLYLFPFNKID